MYFDTVLMEELQAQKTLSPTPTPLPTVIPTPPEVHYETLGETGKRTLWVVCVLMALSSIAFYVMAMRVVVQKRLFHILTSLLTTIAFLSYFAMASGDGITLHRIVIRETKQHIITKIFYRQVFWVRYVDWALTTPLLLIDLGILAGLNGASIFVAVVADLIMVLTGLFAALGRRDDQHWGWYTIACIAYLVILYQLVRNGSEVVARRDTKTKTFFRAIAAFTFIVWTAYPIIWGIAEGAWEMSVDSEIIAYAVLDLLAKPVFGFWLLTTHDRMARTTPTIEGFWAHGFPIEGALRVGDNE